MEKRVWRGIGWVLGICLLTACTLQPSLEEDIHAAVNKVKKSADGGQGNGILRMNYVADNFKWDHMFIFGPYTTQETMNKSLGFPWDEATTALKKTTKSDNLFVFVKGKKVVRYLTHQRKQGDFLPVTQPLSAESAAFIADKVEGRWILRPAASGSLGDK